MAHAQIFNAIRLEAGTVTDGNGNILDDEAIIFFVGDDGSSDITISAPNAGYIAQRLVTLWNAAPPPQRSEDAK